MENNHVYGVEALLRWNHPQKGLLFPDTFLPSVTQEKGIMLRLGRWVFESAFKQLSQLLASGHNLVMSINISSHELKSDGLIDLLKDLLRRYPEISPQHIELEVLESNALEDAELARRMILSAQALGIKISLDDFGTGYSTLSYLKDLPVNIIKIDKSFVIDMLHDTASFSIIEAALGLANAFRCQVVAEGVETVEHGELLLNLGCKLAQGYVIAKPLPFEQLHSWIENFEGSPRWANAKYTDLENRNLLYAIVEHWCWVQMLENYLADPNTHNLPELQSSLCRFGDWLRNQATQMNADCGELYKVHELHELIHTLANELVYLTDDASKQTKMQEVRDVHLQILQALNQCKMKRSM